MRLKISRSKNSASFYITKTVYVDKKEKTITVEKLGTEVSLREKLNGQDPYEWANAYIAELNRKEKEETLPVTITRHQAKLINKNEQVLLNGGYLFLQQLYHQLGLHKICNSITLKHKFTFDLDSILSRLVYGRILIPSSKLNTCEESKRLLERPNFELQHVYRALEVIAQESDFMQSELYKNSLSISKRNDRILYYDCTNYFFEIEQEDNLKQYGYSKEHRPNPIVQMGLFMDGDGIPLAFNINKGNTNEQLTLKPLEQKILKDFNLSKFIVCTDAGLASNDNRRFNDKDDRAFITTQSIKKLKKHLKEWALATDDWHLNDDKKAYDITKLDEDADCIRTFYKERWIKEDGFEQKLIVTYSIKYRNYQRQIRNAQVNRAMKVIDTNPTKLKKTNPNDYKRFIDTTNFTPDGEVADKRLYTIDTELISNEEMFDGFYAVCTNLEDAAPAIIKINHRRWEIEECFRIMKSEFKARPVFLRRSDRIIAHFSTCFLALVLYRYLEKKLDGKFTTTEIISQLKDMNFYMVPGEGYLPAYTRTDFTDALHEAFGFRTDFQIVSNKEMKNIFKRTKQ